MTYQCQYFTINSSISECDHKYETRNAEPDIATDWSSKTRRNLRVDGYGSGFGPPRVSRLGFWSVLEPNQPVFAVQTRTAGGLPGPVANTKYSVHRVLHTPHTVSSQDRLSPAPSVSNGSKFPGRFRVRFQPGTEPLQRVSTQNPLLKSQHFLLQLSI